MPRAAVGCCDEARLFAVVLVVPGTRRDETRREGAEAPLNAKRSAKLGRRVRRSKRMSLFQGAFLELELGDSCGVDEAGGGLLDGGLFLIELGLA